MSSKVPYREREQRWIPTFDSLPEKIKQVLKTIHSSCWWPVWLYGSYARWTRAEDSDLDVWVVSFRAYTKIIQNISKHYDIKIDCNEYSENYHLTIIQ